MKPGTAIVITPPIKADGTQTGRQVYGTVVSYVGWPIGERTCNFEDASGRLRT